MVSTHVELEAKRGVTPATLERIDGLARRDAKLSTTSERLYGSVNSNNFEVEMLNPNDVNDAEYAKELQSQIDWLRSFINFREKPWEQRYSGVETYFVD